MALTDDFQIANLALSRIGISDRLTALADDSAEGRACNDWYAQARDELFQEIEWGFVRKRATLVDVTATSDDPDDWEYAYTIPADLLTPRYIYTGIHQPRPEQRIVFVIEYDTALAVPVIRTNEEDAILVYIAQITNVSLYPPHFIKALYWKLASYIAPELMNDEKRVQFAEARAELYISRAFATEFNYEQEPPERDSTWVEDRG